MLDELKELDLQASNLFPLSKLFQGISRVLSHCMKIVLKLFGGLFLSDFLWFTGYKVNSLARCRYILKYIACFYGLMN